MDSWLLAVFYESVKQEFTGVHLKEKKQFYSMLSLGVYSNSGDVEDGQ